MKLVAIWHLSKEEVFELGIKTRSVSLGLSEDGKYAAVYWRENRFDIEAELNKTFISFYRIENFSRSAQKLIQAIKEKQIPPTAGISPFHICSCHSKGRCASLSGGVCSYKE